MCGIAGVVSFSSLPDEKPVERQVRSLEHRGPDAWGLHRGGHGIIGQTRLAIIDLVTGDPPITNETGDVGAVLNGEIYNYQAVRAELLSNGHTLSTTGDTEVIAHLAETCDPAELASTLLGMFAFAVWDATRARLILGRDPLGKKPLYYWEGSQRLVFGSEIKAVLAHPFVPRNLDAEALPAYLTFGYVPTPRTFFDQIRCVPPGHVLIFERGQRARLEPYWSPQVPQVDGVAPIPMSLPEAATEVKARLTTAVQRRMIADVPIGALLSGGVDSSAVVGLMAQASGRPVQTFTIGFDDTEGFDERGYARLVAERFGTDHTEFVVQPDAVELIDRLVWHYDEPFADPSAIPTFLLAELTRSSVKVALGGDGGDELFAGYPRFPATLLLARYQRLPRPVRRAVDQAVAALPSGIRAGRLSSVRRFMERSDLDPFDAFVSVVNLLRGEWREQLVGDASNWGIDDFRRIWDAFGEADLLDRLLVLNLRTYLLDDLLPKIDRMSMAHALEVRSPFLDRDLVEFALRLPRNLRVRGMGTKRVLRRAVADLLPSEILERGKRGFGIPLDRWFRSDLRSFVDGMLLSPDSHVKKHVSAAALERLVAEHQAGLGNYGMPLWGLLTLEVFLRKEGW